MILSVLCLTGILLTRKREISTPVFSRKVKSCGSTCVSGRPRLFDPVAYFRLQPWHFFTAGAGGSGLWSYSDAGGRGGKGNSWNEYELTRVSFSPVYIASDILTNSKHWEATREGVEDYQYLKMLRDRVAELEKQDKESPFISEGSRLLNLLLQEVIKKAGEKNKV